MAANNVTAIGTCPLLLLRLQKFAYTVISDMFQVFYHAHTISFAVSRIEGFQIIAGKILALKTVFYFSLQGQQAWLSDKRTFFIADAASAAIGYPDTFCFQFVFQ